MARTPKCLAAAVTPFVLHGAFSECRHLARAAQRLLDRLDRVSAIFQSQLRVVIVKQARPMPHGNVRQVILAQPHPCHESEQPATPAEASKGEKWRANGISQQ